MKFRYAALAALISLAPIGAQDDPLPDAASAKVQTKEPPRAGHYVTICDGRSCRQVFVPDAVGVFKTPPTFAVPSPKLFYPAGSLQTCVSDDGTCTQTRVRFMHRGPIRRFFSRR